MCGILCTKFLHNPVVHTCLKLIFSNIGLCILVSLYCVCGAFLFQHLEADVERTKKKAILNAAVDVSYRMDNLRRQLMAFVEDCHNTPPEVNCTTQPEEVIAGMFNEYKMYVLGKKNETDGAYKGQEIDNDTYTLTDWSLPSGILFTASILGTIGYGNVAPKTEAGQLAVIMYAVFAIPLMSMFLFNVGNWFGDGLQWLYHRVACKSLNRARQQNQSKWATKVAPAANGMENGEEKAEGTPMKKEPQVQEKAEDGRDETIPVFLAIIVGMLYIAAGMLLFHGTENWTLIESLYFTFVSLSTIGFGDYVPSANAKTVGDQMRMVMCTAYLFVGLAIFAMCVSFIVGALKGYKRKLRVLMSIVATRVKKN